MRNDLENFVADRARIDLDVIVNIGQFPQEHLRDLAQREHKQRDIPTPRRAPLLYPQRSACRALPRNVVTALEDVASRKKTSIDELESPRKCGLVSTDNHYSRRRKLMPTQAAASENLVGDENRKTPILTVWSDSQQPKSQCR